MLENLDSLLATLIEGLKQRLNNCFNIIIVSEHGMRRQLLKTKPALFLICCRLVVGLQHAVSLPQV